MGLDKTGGRGYSYIVEALRGDQKKTTGGDAAGKAKSPYRGFGFFTAAARSV